MAKPTYLIVLIGCGLYWMLYVPLPPECDYPIIMRLIMSTAEGLKTAAAINFAFGGQIPDVFSFQDWNHPDVAPGLTLSFAEFGGVKAAIYQTTEFRRTEPGSAMIFLHGGGFMIGSINSYAVHSMELAKKTGMLVIVPEYRLAPEHPFPAAYDDCLAVTKDVIRRAEDYGVNPRKVVIAGDSAGGNLAASIALALGQEESPNPLCMINLIYPSLQKVNFRLPSYLQNWNGPLLDNWFLTRFALSYMGFGNNTELAPLLQQNAHMDGFDEKAVLDRASEKWVPAKFKLRPSQEQFEVVPEEGFDTLRANLQQIQSIVLDLRYSSLLAGDDALKLLPRTHIVTCEYDPLRDDGVILHERMQYLGLNSSFINWNFCAHGVFDAYGHRFYKRLDSAVNDMLEVIKLAVDNC